MRLTGFFSSLLSESVTTSKWLRYLLIGSAAVVVLGLFGLLGIWLWPKLPIQAWKVIGLTVFGLSVLWFIIVGIPWYRRHRFLRRQSAELASQRLTDKAEPRRALQRQLMAAKKVLLHSPQLEVGRDPLYRVPWFLFLGDAASGKERLLHRGSSTSPFPEPERGTPNNHEYWYWWFFKEMIAIEADPRFVCDIKDRDMRGIWYQALQLLDRHRSKLPLNGIVVSVSADRLRGGAEVVREYGLQLRRLIDEAMAYLRLQLPVYLVVTNCDALPGFSSFLERLPKGVAGQVLGHQIDADGIKDAAPQEIAEEIFEEICLRLHTIRLGLVKVPMDREARKGVFDFVQTFAALESGLIELVKSLFQENPFQRTPQWRGLYFAAGQQQDAFIDDLFIRFLPSDQPLAKRTQEAGVSRWFRALVGAVCIAGLSWYISYAIVSAHQEDQRFLDQALNACPKELDRMVASEHLFQLLECRERIALFDAANQNRGITFGINRSGRELSRLKDQFVADFNRLVVKPFDSNLEHDIDRGQILLEHYLAVTQRLTLLQACQDNPSTCGRQADTENHIFSLPLTVRVPAVEAALAASEGSSSIADELYQAYLASMRWQADDNPLVAQLQRQPRYLSQMMRGHPPTPQDVVAWASKRYPSYTLSNFWRPSITEVKNTNDPKVESAYTRYVWDNVLIPFVERMVKFSPESADSIAFFVSAYLAEYYRQWGDFLARFLEGYKLWEGEPDGVISFFLQEESAYPLLWESAQYNLFELETRQKTQPPPWQRALQHTLTEDWENAKALLNQLLYAVQKDQGGQESYTLASELYSPQGTARVPASQDFWKLWHLVENPPPEDAAQMGPEDLAAWSAVQGPVRMYLMLLSQRAGEYLESRWQQTVVDPLGTVPRQEKLTGLLGDNGKLNYFIDTWLKPFVTEREHSPKKLLGVTFPLSDGFQAFLYKAENLKSFGDSVKPFNAGTVQFTRESVSNVPDIAKKNTLFELDCQNRKFIASSKAGAATDTKVSIFWSPETCADVRIKIFLQGQEQASDMGSLASEPVILIKTYPGSDGFLKFIEDFKQGAESFSISEFRRSYPTFQWREVSAMLRDLGIRWVRVFIRVDLSQAMRDFLKGPPVLTIPRQLIEPYV